MKETPMSEEVMLIQAKRDQSWTMISDYLLEIRSIQSGIADFSSERIQVVCKMMALITEAEIIMRSHTHDRR